MKPTTEKAQHVQAQGKSRAELDAGYEAYLSALEEDYRTIKQTDFVESKREIGYHAHLRKIRQRDA